MLFRWQEGAWKGMDENLYSYIIVNYLSDKYPVMNERNINASQEFK